MECPVCKTAIAAGATYCPTCRARGAAASAAPVAKPVSPPPAVDRHEKLFLVLACTVSAGALALPKLLRSKAFGPTGKTLLGGCAVLNTTAAIALLVFLVLKGPELLMKYVGRIHGGF